jgi:hypothetical protein
MNRRSLLIVICIVFVAVLATAVITATDKQIPGLEQIGKAISKIKTFLGFQGDNFGKSVAAASEGTKERSGDIKILQAEILAGPYGKAPIQDVIKALSDIPGGPELHLVYQTLAVRKAEALPIIKQKLISGDWYEKFMITKLLRYCPWPETYQELLDLMKSKKDHWLARQGALYALGAIGKTEAGPDIATMLKDPDCPPGMQLVAISTLARIGYQEGVDSIRPYTNNKDIHIRLFASRALAELGQPVDREFLFTELKNPDYIVREEACGALGALKDEEVTHSLQVIAKEDKNEAVRISASQALIQQEIEGRTQPEKVLILKKDIETADRRTAVWIVQKFIDECGAEGLAYIQELAKRNDRIGEQAREIIIFSASQ